MVIFIFKNGFQEKYLSVAEIFGYLQPLKKLINRV